MTTTERRMMFDALDVNGNGLLSWYEIARGAFNETADLNFWDATQAPNIMAVHRVAEVYSRTWALRQSVGGLGGVVGFAALGNGFVLMASVSPPPAASRSLGRRPHRRHVPLFQPAPATLALLMGEADVPAWYQHTPHILSGYRRITHSFRLCASSIWYLHNESVNFYTHAFGSVAFALLQFFTQEAVLRPNSASWSDYLVFTVFHLSAVVCLTNSAIFHLFCCHSQIVQRTCMKCDYVGIVALIVGSMLCSLYYGLYCHPIEQLSYMLLISVAGTITIFVNTSERFAGKKYRPMRTILFIFIGLLGLLPIVHGMIAFEEDSFPWYLALGTRHQSSPLNRQSFLTVLQIGGVDRKLIRQDFFIQKIMCAGLAKATGPLAGLKVLDLTRVLAGPFCSMILADYGADVIKVESLRGGRFAKTFKTVFVIVMSCLADDTRAWGPPFAAGTKESSYFLGINRNKRSLALDFKQPEGLRIAQALARKADVLIENFIPGRLERVGLGYDTLKAENPRLIYASITGYGPSGPSAQEAGYDVVIEAEAGLMHITGTRDTPVKVGVAITDITSGLFTHGAIMAALLARSQTGVGQKIDVSLLESQVSALANVAHAYLIGGVEGTRLGTEHASIVPYQAFPTHDGHIVIGAGNDGQFKKFVKAIGCPELADIPDFQSNEKRVENRKSLIDKLSVILQTRSTRDWLAILKPIGLPCGPVNTISQTFAHPQVLHRQMVEVVDHPTAGKIKLVGIPVKFSNTIPTIRMPPPLLGQHTDEILEELDYSKGDIAQLRHDKVVA
ncbi:hypothetical protein HDU84_004715 [Entophlyctis sp. JEL0112]|nr:hypothetical protein HDU84_004715 [Entophlyctis sp. JEL0112]